MNIVVAKTTTSTTASLPLPDIQTSISDSVAEAMDDKENDEKKPDHAP